MSMMLLEPPVAGAPLLPCASGSVTLRLHALACAIDGLVDPNAARRDPAFTGCVVMPYAGIVLAGTACRRPLLFSEGEALGRHTGMDLVLLRFDAERGVTFDVRLQERFKWLCRYAAWRREGDLWLVPDVGPGTFLRAAAWGLELEHEAPFRTLDERAAGIVRALDFPFFEGGL